MGQLELMKLQTVKTNEALICPNPEIAIGSLCDGRYRSARQTSLSPPRAVKTLRTGPGGLTRSGRNSEADAREPANGILEIPALSKTVLPEGIKISKPQRPW